ncbi:helix-turn-helix transcriptional regulator [candidate division NPL-UPA2 bacterium]|nr:helix-turn-helix transcriptional regulator [candidate division NPL-UPA2 bacterium]
MNNLKELRMQKKITQEEVARLLQINPQYYSMLERGARTPGFKLAKKIADFYGNSIDKMFFETFPKNRPGKRKLNGIKKNLSLAGSHRKKNRRK